MPVEINYEMCNRCGICLDSCMMDVIRREGETVRLIYLEDCQDCFLCVKDCPVDAVKILPT
jgi:ferredoxin